jgi:Predicted ATPase with chaperone activity
VSDLLRTSSAKLNLSPRSYHRVVKVARTIADLAGAEDIAVPHVLEALQFRVQL